MQQTVCRDQQDLGVEVLPRQPADVDDVVAQEGLAPRDGQVVRALAHGAEDPLVLVDGQVLLDVVVDIAGLAAVVAISYPILVLNHVVAARY